MTAWWGFSTRVETIVAMEFAASWKPFMKSNARAATTRTTTTVRLMGADSINRGSSAREASFGGALGMLEHYAFDDVRDVLATVGNELEQLVDGAQLDQLLHVRLFAEEPRHGRAHDAVGVGLQAVDLLARLHDGFRVAQVGEQRDGGLHAVARHLADLRELHRLGR